MYAYTVCWEGSGDRWWLKLGNAGDGSRAERDNRPFLTALFYQKSVAKVPIPTIIALFQSGFYTRSHSFIEPDAMESLLRMVS